MQEGHLPEVRALRSALLMITRFIPFSGIIYYPQGTGAFTNRRKGAAYTTVHATGKSINSDNSFRPGFSEHAEHLETHSHSLQRP